MSRHLGFANAHSRRSQRFPQVSCSQVPLQFRFQYGKEAKSNFEMVGRLFLASLRPTILRDMPSKGLWKYNSEGCSLQGSERPAQ